MTYGQPPSDQGGNNQGGYGQQPTPGGGYTPPAGGGFQPTQGGGYTPPAGGGYTPPPAGGYQPPPAGGYQPPGGGYAPPPSPVYGGPQPSGGTNVMAIISLIAGILSIPTFCTVAGAIILGLVAVVLGFLGRNQAKNTGQGAGIALAGIITGAIGIVLGLIYVLFIGAAVSSVGGLGGLMTQAAATLTATAP